MQNYVNCESTTLLNSIKLFKNDLSNKTIKNFIKNKMVFVNNKVIVNSSYMLKNGDIVEIFYNRRKTINYDIDILYEDEYLVIINKPSGLLSISNEKEKEITAYRMVSDYVKSNSNHKYIFVVHRLDQDTSGILIFSKNEKIRDMMQKNWNTIVKKRGYVAIVEGTVNKEGTFHTFLVEDRHQFVHSSKSGYGKEAITHYSLIKKNHIYSMVQVFIDTGRRNQIRVHFSENGHAIVGDKKYGCKSNPIKRLCLHANILEFVHPVSKKIVCIKCDIPNDMNKLI